MRKSVITILLCFCLSLVFLMFPMFSGNIYAQKHPSKDIALEEYLQKALSDKLKQKPQYISKLSACLKKVSCKYNIPVRTLLAFVLVESTGNNKAKNGACIGLTQINYPVWSKALKKAGIVRSRNDLYKPVVAIEACAFIYSHYKEKAHNKKHSKAIIAYSGGSSKYYRKIRHVEKHYAAYIKHAKDRKDEKS